MGLFATQLEETLNGFCNTLTVDLNNDANE